MFTLRSIIIVRPVETFINSEKMTTHPAFSGGGRANKLLTKSTMFQLVGVAGVEPAITPTPRVHVTGTPHPD